MRSERRLCGVRPKNGASAYQGGTGERGMVVERRGHVKCVLKVGLAIR